MTATDNAPPTANDNKHTRTTTRQQSDRHAQPTTDPRTLTHTVWEEQACMGACAGVGYPTGVQNNNTDNDDDNVYFDTVGVSDAHASFS